MTWQLRALQCYAMGTTALLAVVVLTAFRPAEPRTLTLDELTVRSVRVVDSTGRVRVRLAGSFPPRRTALAGLLFDNEDGTEAGGLVYRGTRRADGRVSAGGTLTMDQYREDQIVALSYAQEGARKQHGLTIVDRPDSMGPELAELYRVLDPMPEGPRRDSTRRALLARVPAAQRSARRVFVGSDTARTAALTLADRTGAPRLRLAVDSLGRASIEFLDASGRVTRSLTDLR
jgi:hypothetical protein